ncbi:MAG TPA: RloB family protein [bacterium]|nr:RloB family protein [bacterium]
MRTRQSRSLDRALKKASKTQTSILIVCEGEKTEPFYFYHWRRDLKQVADITIVGGDICGTNPKNIVQYARDHKEGYDSIWCVFDRDEHKKVPEAFDQAKAHGFNVAFSNPCFELWFLIHFQDQTAHIERVAVCRKVKSHIKGYEKSADIYGQLVNGQGRAIARAVDLRKRNRDNGKKETDNPSTGVDRLVVYLNSLNEAKKKK